MGITNTRMITGITEITEMEMGIMVMGIITTTNINYL
jgi:hypothetical protein